MYVFFYTEKFFNVKKCIIFNQQTFFQFKKILSISVNQGMILRFNEPLLWLWLKLIESVIDSDSKSNLCVHSLPNTKSVIIFLIPNQWPFLGKQSAFLYLKICSNLKNLIINSISSIRTKNAFRKNINLFDFKESRF